MCLNVRVVAAGSAQVFTVGANRPGWTILHTSHNSGGTGAQPHTSCILAKIYQAGDVFPGSASTAADSISWTSNGKYALSVAAITPAAGSQIRIANDILSATPVIDTANTTTHDTPDLNAGSLTGLDLVIAASRAQVDGATAVTATVPSGWTEPANADWSTATGTGAAARQVQTVIGKKDGSHRQPGRRQLHHERQHQRQPLPPAHLRRPDVIGQRLINRSFEVAAMARCCWPGWSG